MEDHSWIDDVLQDLATYCQANGLQRTEHALRAAKSALIGHQLDVEPENLTLENQLAAANRRPVPVDRRPYR